MAAAQRAATLADVAREAGFSKSTASLVFQDSPLPAAATRQAILDAAARLGYVYNRRAASLRSQRSNTIGMVVGALANPFFSELVEAVEEELAPAGFTVLLGTTLEDLRQQATLIQTLLEYRIDGLLIVPAHGSTPEFARPLEQMGLPHVVLTRKYDGLRSPYVGLDDAAAGRLGGEHLIGQGSRTLAYLGGPPGVYTRDERLRGFRAAVAGAGRLIDERWCAPTKTSSGAGYEAAEALLAAGPPPDAILCHSDAIAYGLMHALADHGFVVGSDVRVVGFDNLELSKHSSPSLTSISVEAREMGKAAVEMLLRQMNGESAGEAVVFAPRLEVRESCGST